MPEYDIKKMRAYLANAAVLVRCGTLTDAAIDKMKEECKLPPPAPAYYVLGFYDAFDGWSIFDQPNTKEIFGFEAQYSTRAEAQAVCDKKNEELGQCNKNCGERWQVFTNTEVRGRYR